MPEEQKQSIESFRNVGLGYLKIGIVLDLPRDKVRNYCKANGMDGNAKRLLQIRESKRMKENCGYNVCRQCGKHIERNRTGRNREEA